MHRKSFLTIPRTHKMGDLPYLVEIAISHRVPPRAVRILSSAVRMLSSTVRMLPITVRMLPVTVRIFPITAQSCAIKSLERLQLSFSRQGSLPRPPSRSRKHAKRPDTSWTRLRGHYSLSPLSPIFPPLDLVHACCLPCLPSRNRLY